MRNPANLLTLSLLLGTLSVGQMPAAAAAQSRSAPTLSGVTVRGTLIGSVRGDAEGAAISKQMDERAARLDAALPSEFTISRVGEGIILTGPGEANLRLWDVATKPLWTELRADPAVQVFVVGHSFRHETEQKDMAISYRLAKAMEQVITSISDRQVRIEGRGRLEPITSNATPAGRLTNSRIEIGFYVPFDE